MRWPCLLPLLLAGCSNDQRPGDPPPGEATGTPGGGELVFIDVSAECGLEFVHDAGLSADKQLPETMGAGAALGDFNGDGFLDLYLVQSGPLPLPGDRGEAPPNELWLGDGQGRFRDATSTSGDGAHRGYGMGVALGDYNGDGRLDLYVTNLGPDVLLRGDGRGSFTDVSDAAGISDERWTAGSTCTSRGIWTTTSAPPSTAATSSRAGAATATRTTSPGFRIASGATAGMAPSKMQRLPPGLGTATAKDSARAPATSTMTATSTCTSPTTRSKTGSGSTPGAVRSVTALCSRARASTGWA